jgi:hypothetical protein
MGLIYRRASLTIRAEMEPVTQTRREYLTIEASNGRGGVVSVLISHQRIVMLSSRSKGQILEAGEIVPAVLKSPKAIFEGFCTEGDEDTRGVGWRCYVGLPDRSYTVDGQRRPPWEDEVFLVFLNVDRVAYNWRWEKCDLDAPNLPRNHADRFKQRVL